MYLTGKLYADQFTHADIYYISSYELCTGSKEYKVSVF